MKTKCMQKDLMAGLSVVKRAVMNKTVVPIYAHILISAKGNRLRLSATNQQISITCWISAETQEDGAVTVPGQLLSNFVAGLPNDDVELTLHKAAKRLQLKCGNHKSRMNGFDAEEFPVGALSPEKYRTPSISLDPLGLAQMIDRTAFAASTDFSKPSINGAETSVVGDSIQMVATDSFRLSKCAMYANDEIKADPFSVIIQAQHLKEISSIVASGDEDSPVRFSICRPDEDADPNQAVFVVKGDENTDGCFLKAQISTQLVAADYPVYKAFLPQGHTTRMVMKTSEFKQAMRSMRLFAMTKMSPVDFDIRPDDKAVTMKIDHVEMGGNESTLDAEISGDPSQISFSAQYLTEILNQIDETHVIIETGASNAPASVLASGVERDDFLHVLMPMSTRGKN